MGKNEVDLTVLGALLGGPAHEYEVKKRVSIDFNRSGIRSSDSDMLTIH